MFVFRWLRRKIEQNRNDRRHPAGSAVVAMETQVKMDVFKPEIVSGRYMCRMQVVGNDTWNDTL